MKMPLTLFLCCVCCLVWGEVAAIADFSGVKAGKNIRVAHTGDGTVLSVVVTEQQDVPGMNAASFPVDLIPYRGKAVVVSARIRYRGITGAEKPYHGGKFMLAYRTGKLMKYPGAERLHGSSEWKLIRFAADIPVDADAGVLKCGLQGAAGRIEFREIRLEPAPFLSPPVTLPESFQCAYSPEIRDLPAFRGFMSPRADEAIPEDVADMAALGANLVRWQLWAPDDVLDKPKAYLVWMSRQMDKLERLLPEFERLGMKLIIDLHTPPGGRSGRIALLGTAGEEAAEAAGGRALHRMANDEEYYRTFLRFWREAARRFCGKSVIYGYDLVNEPAQKFEAERGYLQQQYEAAKAIREIDPETPIIIASNNWNCPEAFTYLHPLPLRNLIYQVHAYLPGAYSHQGIGLGEDVLARLKLKAYPGMINGVRYDKEQLRYELAPVIAFQKRYGARILVGEFSAARWSPGADRYLRDLIELFEEYRWDWAYHAFRESDAWDAEIADTSPRRIWSADRVSERRKPGVNSRLQILKEAFRKNRLE